MDNKSQANDLDAGAQQEMLLSAKKFRALVENNDAIIALVDENLNSIYRSSSAARITGWTHAEFEKITVAQYIHPDDMQLVISKQAEAIANPGKTIPLTARFKHKDGHWLWLEGTVTSMLHDPDIKGIITNMRDITEKKETEEKIYKIKRLYYFISQVNQLIVRTKDEATLFKEACGIAVESGEFKMAWIGKINEENQSLTPVMYAGEENGYLAVINSIFLEKLPESSLPIVAALRDDRYFICNDIENDPVMLLWRNEAISRGYRSLICLPVKNSARLIGVFVLYAGTINFFTEVETALLKEVTGDIAFALENFEKEEMRKKAGEEITKLYRDKETLLNRINDGMISVDNEWRYTFINDAALATHSLGREATLGKVLWDIHPELNGTVFWAKYHEAKATGKVMEIESFYEPLQKWFSVKIYPSADGLTIFYNDITERLKAHDEVIRERNLSDSIINSLPGIFYLYNKEGKFLRWNTNFETVTGYTGEEIKQMHPLDFFDGSEKALLTQKIGNVFITGEDNVLADFSLKNKEKIPYYFTGKAVEYQGQPCLLGVGIDFTDRVMAQEKIRETTEQLRMLTAHLQNIREEERKRIGREIHDDLGQQLTAIKMDVAWLDRKMPAEETIYKNKLKNIIGMLDSSNKAIRRILSELRPGILDDYGLLEAIDWLGTQFMANTGTAFEFVSTEKKIHAPEPVVTCIFRVFQEALTNITRHAHAAHVFSSLTINDGFIIVHIKDDGKGFDPSLVQIHRSFGILGMKERVMSLGGEFELHASPGNGTAITMKLPVTFTEKN